MTQIANSRTIMLEFAASSGLSDTSQPPRRYLWTDAFAVCNYLELFRQSGDPAFLQLALELVDQVHRVLGRHRADSGQQGWLSGLDDQQAHLHPTRGGLRIGKPLNERGPDEAYRQNFEWDKDGQYFHYLTKWMHALYRVFRVTGREDYLRWALELAKTAHRAFTYTPAAGAVPRMFWKMSIDLSRPLVDTMGQHDPLDGLITFLQLHFAARDLPAIPAALSLDPEITVMRRMSAGLQFATRDPLGIGGLLGDASRLAQLIDRFRLEEMDRLKTLLLDIEHSLQAYVAQNPLGGPAQYRLAFRELGLAIGLRAISGIHAIMASDSPNFSDADPIAKLLGELSGFQHLHEIIEDFWCEPVHRMSQSWRQHADINDVMLATALSPDGFLQL